MGELFEVQSCEDPCFGRSEFGLYATYRIVFDGVESTEVQVFGIKAKLDCERGGDKLRALDWSSG